MPTYIVTCKKDASDAEVAAAKDYAKSQGGEITREYNLIKGFVVKYPENTIQTLSEHPNINSVELDGKVTTQ